MSMIFSFHGSDHKNGCTMISQSVAEMLAEYKREANILLIFLNSRQSLEFMAGDMISIDHFKSRLESGMPIDEMLLRSCRRRDRFYVIAGLENEMEHRRYFPDHSRILLKELKSRFDIVIADTGSDVDSGLALGGLLESDRNCMILAQNEASIKRYERNTAVYDKLSLNFDYYLLNKFSLKEPYSMKYISQRLRLPKDSLMKVTRGGYEYQAEAERKSLLEYENDQYSADIFKIASVVSENAGFGEIITRRNKIWKNFI